MKFLKLCSVAFLFSLNFIGVIHAALPTIKPFPPFRIAGNLYYVGNDYQASYLVATSKGNILINSDYQFDVPMIKASIEKLGFKFNDIKILLISQAHADHVGGSALIKEMTGAAYMVMDADVPTVETGGKADFLYGHSTDPDNFYRPTKVDRVLHDGDQVKLGNTVLTAYLTPGHTKGCTTWTMKVSEKGRNYNVVIVGGMSINPGTQLIHNMTYPQIVNDYQRMWKTLKSLPCELFLGAHGVYFDLKKKYALMQKTKTNTFIDPEGYKKFIASKEQEFNNEFAKQKSNRT